MDLRPLTAGKRNKEKPMRAKSKESNNKLLRMLAERWEGTWGKKTKIDEMGHEVGRCGK